MTICSGSWQYRDRLRLEKLCQEREAGVYCGVDATAKSLHVGHMVPFMALFWMCLYGHVSVSLVRSFQCKLLIHSILGPAHAS